MVTTQMPGQNILISVIDDDEAVREAVATLLRSLGYEADKFASAEEFLSSESLTTASCLIVDIQMPSMSGPALQARLAADGRGTPIIFITGVPDSTIRAGALQAGAFGFLCKPLDEDTLVACIDRALS